MKVLVFDSIALNSLEQNAKVKLSTYQFFFLSFYDKSYGMSSIRQGAAIMFTDIAGYTSLMGEDEQQHWG